jgi:hypothetical protein
MRAQFLILACGVFLWLLMVVLSAWRQRRQSEALRNAAPTVPPVLPRAPPMQPPRGVVPRGTSVPAMGWRGAPRQRVSVRPGSRREVRRGMILMTILGPCRALARPEPPR